MNTFKLSPSKIWAALILVGLLLSSCSPKATPPPPSQTAIPTGGQASPAASQKSTKPVPKDTPIQPATGPTAQPPTAAPATPAVPTAAPTLQPSPTTSEPPQPSPATSTPLQPAAPVTPYTENIAGIHAYFYSRQQAELFRQSGVLWSRFDDFNWDDIEPVRTDSPTYDWTAVSEQDLLTAVDSGGQIIGIVLFTPEWAHKYPGIACGPIKQEAFSAFAQFLQALVQRYGQPPFNVKYWELGNEPDVDKNLVSPHNGFGCWGEAGDAYFGGGYYAEMLKVVYPAIKAVDPSAQVLVGGLLLNCDPLNPPENPPGSGNRVDCTPSRFFEGILANGGGDFFDGVSYHAYDYYGLETGVYGMGNWNSLYNTTGPVLVTKGRYLKSLLAQYNQAGKYLINTEVGLLCGRDGNEPECQQDAFVQTKSYYVAEAYASALAEGLRGNVWYSLPGWRGTELMDINKQPVPAFDALRFSAAQLKGAVYAGEIGQYPGVKGYEFTRAGKKFWFLWSLDGVDHAIQLPSVPAAIYDVYGIAQKPKQDLLVTIAPLYIEWGQ